MQLISFEEAVARALSSVSLLPPERVAISDALGRSTASRIVASRTLPPWNNAAMDGYAVRASDVQQAGIELRISATVSAGIVPRPLEPGTCARIMTGAVVPPGADAVVMQERVRSRPGFAAFDDAPAAGQHIRLRGEDLEAGTELIPTGAPIGVGEAAALWAQGLTTVDVHRRPTVAIVSSGDELEPVGSTAADRIIDTNSPVIAELVRLAGGRPDVLGCVPDRLEAIEALCRRGLDADVLITVSGASVGDHDFTKTALANVGVTTHFWGIAIKPGKPVLFGTAGSTVVFALPGNPVSAMVTFELFVRPVLRALQGLPPSPALSARLDGTVTKPKGLRHFLRASARLEAEGLVVTPRTPQSSGAVASLRGVSHLISIGPDVTQVPSGAVVDVVPLSWGT